MLKFPFSDSHLPAEVFEAKQGADKNGTKK
jgi:hypothetical protein